ncbi:MAG TPA: YbaB/EbfC family nucleoid-associated protein [Candidatus Limnocylindrales bacterium]|jgi:nucleoid-associated protein EbfC|nr:YbaB/EbfC family nucleoid-associated protein [Candidatus Limnocylindrales bacterium]
MKMGDLAKMAQQMQVEMARVQAELEALTHEATAGGGAVRAVINGRQELVELHIDPEVVDREDVEMLQDLVTAAVNDGLRQVKQTAEQKMARVTGGMGLPPGFG